MARKLSSKKPRTDGGLIRVNLYLRPEVYAIINQGKDPRDSESTHVGRILEQLQNPDRWCVSLPGYQSKNLEALRSSAPYSPTREQFLQKIVDDFIEEEEARMKSGGRDA